MRALIRSAVPAALGAALALVPAAIASAAPASRASDSPVLWPAPQRAFLQDGPGLLLSEVERAELTALDEDGRARWIAGFLGSDPDPATPLNELAEGIERRRQLAASEFLSPLDVRARLLFLNGRPAAREQIECDYTFKPLEIWSYPGRPGGPGEAQPQQLVVYRPSPDLPWRLWVPLDSKRVLYTSEMEYWLQQVDELRGRVRGRRFDRVTCKDAERVDDATGVRALRGYRDDRPRQSDYERFLEPPDDLAVWAGAAAATPLPDGPPPLPLDSVVVAFPEIVNQRTVARAYLTLPPGSGVATPAETGEPALELIVEGVVEQDGEIFEDFRLRFQQPRADETTPIVLAVDRPLRPERAYLLRLRVSDPAGGAASTVASGFTVPGEPQPLAEPPIGEIVDALEYDVASKALAGADSLILVPPPSDVVLGLWRTEALVTGSRIVKVIFLIDGEPRMTATRRPFGVEMRLAEVPREQVVRAEGYDAEGVLIDADEVVVNQARGALQVRIVEPERGWSGAGPVEVRAEVVVPEEQRVVAVEFRLNDQTVATLDRPPWTATVEVPPAGPEEVTYLSAVARLNDGRSAEAVRFLNAPEFLEEVNVDLVELYTAVTDRDGRPVQGLTAESFEVYEDGRRQEIRKFERVENLPLTVGIAVDVSGSMVKTLGEAQAAGQEFIERVLRPGDRCFVLSFAFRPELLMSPIDDAEACREGLDDLAPYGATALHDAVVTSLYYFRGFQGQRAFVLISDGDDTASSIAYPVAAEYARRSGVAIYAVGIGTGGLLGVGVRSKLRELAEETGGRIFFIGRAEELDQVYDEIEHELRSRYLIAYQSDRPAGGGDEYREVEVKVEQRGLEARTIRGYYP